jgi:hypothetical protein
MGGSSSKPGPIAAVTAPVTDFSTLATQSIIQAGQQAQQQAQAALAQSQAAVSAATQEASSAWGWAKVAGWSILVLAILFGLLVLYQWLALNPLKGKIPPIPGFSDVIPDNDLSVTSAKHGNTDVTSSVINMISSGSLNIPASISQTLSSKGISGLTESDSFVITYQYAGDSSPLTYTVDDKTAVVISPSNKPGTTASGSPPTKSTQATAPAGSGIFGAIFGTSTSGDQLSSLHDATGSASVSATSAPLSSKDQGAYGMQWWMFIKDWNYGYGKEKSVVKRSDSTSGSVMNPHISLHPTDNTLRVSVSIFPDSEGSGSKTEPAPAGGSGASTDDVFICEVPDVPLQTWFSVGVTVFSRNLDIYIDGKLVKSCLLPGVPKPAVGDVQISPGGGFSGYMCNFYHYSRMLTPSDAVSFYSSGTSCQNSITNAGPTTASGYSVKFGVYNPAGKEIQEYTF